MDLIVRLRYWEPKVLGRQKSIDLSQTWIFLIFFLIFYFILFIYDRHTVREREAET